MRLTKNQIKRLRSLAQKKNRDAEQRFILEGWRSLHDALEARAEIDFVAVLGAVEDYPHYAETLSGLEHKGIPLYTISEIELRQISDTVSSQGILALVKQKSWTFADINLKEIQHLVFCDGITDPGNLGTILRTCDWFGVDAALLGKGCVSLFNEKVVRSTAGSIFHFPILENVSVQQELPRLQALGFSLLTGSLDGNDIDGKYSFPEKTVLVIGNEAHGVSDEIKRITDKTIKIPRLGKAESLNAGVACGIILARWLLKKA